MGRRSKHWTMLMWCGFGWMLSGLGLGGALLTLPLKCGVARPPKLSGVGLGGALQVCVSGESVRCQLTLHSMCDEARPPRLN